MRTEAVSRDAGLDLLRVLAMVIVAAQHGLTATGHYDWTVLSSAGMSIGQFGVAIFCAISGWLALGDRDAPASWFAARLVKIYPAYWLATLFAFALALGMARPVTVGLFVSQMAGTGFFTHGWDLVNVVSWFMSLLLLCYALAAIARMTKFPGFVLLIFAAGAALLIVFHIEVSLSRHVIAFAVAGAARTYRRPAFMVLLAVVLMPLLLLQESFVYSCAALPALWLARGHAGLRSSMLAVAAAYTYEFFLLHGIFLAGAAKIIHQPALAILIGVAASLPAAFVLKRAAAMLTTAALSMRPARSAS